MHRPGVASPLPGDRGASARPGPWHGPAALAPRPGACRVKC